MSRDSDCMNLKKRADRLRQRSVGAVSIDGGGAVARCLTPDQLKQAGGVAHRCWGARDDAASQGSFQIANGRKKARFVRRSWRGSNPRRPPRLVGPDGLHFAVAHFCSVDATQILHSR